MAGTVIKLIVGLGNPGAEYARTRHNAGFWLVDELARRHGGTFRHEAKHQAELARVRIDGEEIWLAKPMTYMNRSGGPVSSVLGFYKIPPAQMLVETDAPYLTPTPYRGRPNASYLIPVTVRALAGFAGVDLDELCATISATGERVLGPWS